MNNILKIKTPRKYEFVWGYLIRYFAAIVAFVLVLTIYFNNISIEKKYITIITFLLIVASSFLGGITSGVVTSLILLLGLEKFNANMATPILISSIVSKVIIVICISHIKKSFPQCSEKFKNEISLYKYILDFVKEGILLTSNGEIVYANKNYKKYFARVDKLDKDGTRNFEHIEDTNEEELKQVYKRFEDKLVVEYKGESDSSNLLEIKSKKIYDEGTFLTVVNDVTERVKKIERIKKGKKRYKQILNIVPLGVLIHVNDKIIFANNKAADMLRYGSYKFIIGEHVKKHIKHDYKNIFYSSLDRLREETEMKLMEIQMVDNNGELLTAKVINSIIPFKKQSILTIIKDITEEKRKEEKKLILEETITYEKVKSEFLANISHDIKTPINVIYSSLQIIESAVKTGKLEDESKKIAQYIKIMKQNCYRELKIANNLIDLSRYEMNGFELNLEKINIVSVVEDIVTEVASISREKNIELVFDTEDEEIICYVDRIKIERVILNLLSNSIKFTKENGEIWVFVTTKKDSIILTVKDNGIGIPKNKINYIFDRFKQIDKSFTRIHEGSGLGLSVVKAIVNLHGGSIRVDSKEGLGTEISIALYKRDEELAEENIDNFFKDYNEIINIEFSDIYL